jgi:hypothetical protein
MRAQLLVQIDAKHQALCTFNGSGLCRYCGADVHWVVKPDGRKLPVNPGDDDRPFVSHFATCKARVVARERRRYSDRGPRIDYETGEVLDG